MDEDRRFARLERLLFQGRELQPHERWLGLLLLGLLLLGAWLIFWPLIPSMISATVTGLIDLFSGGPPPTPVPPTPGPLPSPSPSPSPSPVALLG